MKKAIYREFIQRAIRDERAIIISQDEETQEIIKINAELEEGDDSEAPISRHENGILDSWLRRSRADEGKQQSVPIH